MEESVDALRFNLMWRQHTGQWLCLYRAVKLEEALRLIEIEPLLQPIS
jgi:hypothetical protein